MLALATLASGLVVLGPAVQPAAAATSGSYISDIKVVEGNGAACPSGYSRDGTDLNEDAGGAYLYACWNFTNDRSQALHGIAAVADGNNDEAVCPGGFAEVTKPNGNRIDLNKGAGHDFVRLCQNWSASFGPAIVNADIVTISPNAQFWCNAAGTGNHPGYVNAGPTGKENIADFGTNLNSGFGLLADIIHLCYKREGTDETVRIVQTLGDTAMGQVDTWLSPSAVAHTPHFSCPAPFDEHVFNWRNRSDGGVVVTDALLAPPGTDHREITISNAAPEPRRLLLDFACSKKDRPSIPPGQGSLDSGCGGEGQRVCWGAFKFSGWRLPDWQFTASLKGACDSGLKVSGGEDDSTCIDITRHQQEQRSDDWDVWAAKQQNDLLGADEPINLVPLLKTHESYSTHADGYPAPNQRYSLSDQLDGGVRMLDLRPRWGVGTTEEHLRLSHGSNECAGCLATDRLYTSGIQEIGSWMQDNPGQVVVVQLGQFDHQATDSEIPYLTDPLRKYIGEDKILSPAEWCTKLMSYPLTDAMKTSLTADGFTTDCANIPSNSLDGADFKPYRWPTRAEMQSMGTTMIAIGQLDSSVTFGDDPTLFYKNTMARKFKASDCSLNGTVERPGAATGTTTAQDYFHVLPEVFETRVIGQALSDLIIDMFNEFGDVFDLSLDELADAELNPEFQDWPGYLYAYGSEFPVSGDSPDPTIQPFATLGATVDQVVGCNYSVNIDMFGSDNNFNGITSPSHPHDNGDVDYANRLDGMIWTWRDGDYGAANSCAQAASSDHRFVSHGCGELAHVACAAQSGNGAYRTGDPFAWGGTGPTRSWDIVEGTKWKVTAGTYTFDQAFNACQDEFPATATDPTYVFAVPTTKLQNLALADVAGADDVWIGFTNRGASSQWHIQRTPPPFVDVSLTNADGTQYTPGTWTNQAVTASFDCVVPADRTVGVDTLPAPITLSGEGADQSVSSGTGECKDDVGNAAAPWSTADIDIDLTAPELSDATLNPAPNAAGWNNSDVTVTRSCTDALSGAAAPTASGVIDDEGTNGSVTVTCTDEAGNSASAATTGVKIDRTRPSSGVPQPAPTANANGWYRTDVTLTSTCTDLLSGPATASVSVTLATEGANQTASLKCADVAGNLSAAARVTGINVDKTAPVLSAATLTPAATSFGWRNGNVTVSHTCTDPLSGPVSASPSTTVTGEGADLSGTVTCTDKAGNTASNTTTGIKIDRTAPATGAASFDTPANANGWWKTSVTATRPCTDALSGPVHATESGTLSVEGAGQSLTITCADQAGNTTPATATGINIDLTKPVLSAATLTPSANAFGWRNGDVTVSHTCTDALSGPTNASPSQVVTGEGDALSATVTCTDKAGNADSKTQSGIKIDRTAPGIGAASFDPEANAAGWWRTDVKVSRPCSDSLSGAVETTVSTVVATEGAANSAGLTCTDKAGNTKSATSTGIKVDKTNPTISAATVTPPANSFGWHKSDVTVTRTCADTLSGRVDPSVSGQITNEGANQSVTLTCKDVAGNSVSATTSGINLDETKPVVTYSGQKPKYTILEDVAVTCTATDALSGIATNSCANVTGPAWKLQPGTNTYSASATDKAGNADGAQVTFTVDATYDELCSLTEQFVGPVLALPYCVLLTTAKTLNQAPVLRNSFLVLFEQLVDKPSDLRIVFTPEQSQALQKWSRSLRANGCARC